MRNCISKMMVALLVNAAIADMAIAQSMKSHIVSVGSSHIKINGETNINKFGCELFIPTATDTLEVKSQKTQLSIAFEQLILTYKVNDFDCGMSALTHDFRDILNAENYPFIKLQINQIDVNPKSEGFERLMASADVTVTIAGVSQDLLILNSYVINRTESDLTLFGRQSLKMTGFGITPPTRLLGALRVYDLLDISFEISMTSHEK